MTKRNRMGVETFVTRRFNHLCGNHEWFEMANSYEERLQEIQGQDKSYQKEWRKPKNDDRYIESVVFIPFTPESRLKSGLSRLEASLGFKTRIRYIEEAGRSISSLLVKKDPEAGPCGRPNCFPCRTKG